MCYFTIFWEAGKKRDSKGLGYTYSMYFPTKMAASAAGVLMSARAYAQTITPAPSTASAAAPSITAVSSCHGHGTVQ